MQNLFELGSFSKHFPFFEGGSWICPAYFLRLIIKLMFQQYISIFKVKMKLDCLLTACFSQTLWNKFLSVVNLRYDGRTSHLNNQNDPLERLDFVFVKFNLLTPSLPSTHTLPPNLQNLPPPFSHTLRRKTFEFNTDFSTVVFLFIF